MQSNISGVSACPGRLGARPEVSPWRWMTSRQGRHLLFAVARALATAALFFFGLAVQPDGRGLLLGLVLSAVVAAWARLSPPPARIS